MIAFIKRLLGLRPQDRDRTPPQPLPPYVTDTISVGDLEPGRLYSVTEFDPPVTVKNGDEMLVVHSGQVFVNGKLVSTAKTKKVEQ
jgi:hypothetical protein